MRRREYFTQIPKLAPAIAEIAAERGVVNICIDFSCDSFKSKRADFTQAIINPNSEFRDRAHSAGLIVTENLCNLDKIGSEVFLLCLPIKGEGMTTSPTRPVALTKWPSDTPSIYDVSTPLLNHWRWRMEIWRDKSQSPDGFLDQTQYIQSGHAFTHCDAPRHMEQDGPTIQDLPNMGLDLFLGDATIIDISDIELPSPVTADLLERRCGGNIKQNQRIILRSDLTNRLGYKSTRWHTHAPNIDVSAADWLISKKPDAICLDFPQDYIAREMPGRHVYNHEFEIHHKIFQAGIPFIEDLKDLGEVKKENIFLAAVPLKMNCIDGAPMRAVIINW
jgi:arylformamidase